MEKVDTRDDTIKVATMEAPAETKRKSSGMSPAIINRIACTIAGQLPSDANAAREVLQLVPQITGTEAALEASSGELDNLIQEHRSAVDAFEGAPDADTHSKRFDVLNDLENKIAGYRCRLPIDYARKADFMLEMSEKDDNVEGNLGHFGPMILRSMIEAPIDDEARWQAVVDLAKETGRKLDILERESRDMTVAELQQWASTVRAANVHPLVEDWRQALEAVNTREAETKPCDIEAMANELDRLGTKHAKESFEVMSPSQLQAALSALCSVRDSLLGSINQPRIGNDEIVHQYVDGLLEEINGRVDALYHSLLNNRPQDADTRVDWLTALIAYFGKTDCLANEIGYDVPGLIDELQAVTLKSPVQRVPITSSSPAPKPQNSTDFSDAEKQLLDCLEYGEIVGKRKDDRTTNEEGYDLLDKIHMDTCDVFHRNIDARVVAQASRPCNSIADVKDRVALLLHATYEELDDSTVNDVFAAVRSSILTFARERVTQ